MVRVITTQLGATVVEFDTVAAVGAADASAGDTKETATNKEIMIFFIKTRC